MTQTTSIVADPDTVTTVTPRRKAMETFLTHSGWEGARIEPLAGDASFRRYERVFLNGKQAVLMDAPPEKEDIVPFITIGRYLENAGFSAPHIIAEDREHGFLLLEDLGDSSYTRLLAADNSKEKELYREAVAVLAALHRQNKERGVGIALQPYDHAAYMREISLFADWYLPAVMGGDAAARKQEYLDLWKGILSRNPLGTDVAVLRDYHADNLLWLPGREGIHRVGLLDFQDALMGHPAYDLVSLLEDARRDVAPETVQEALAYYCKLTGADVDALADAYALLGAQRNAKIIGIFVRLGVRDGKKHYTRYLPRVWRHYLHDLQHPELKPLLEWTQAHILPEWRGAITLP